MKNLGKRTYVTEQTIEAYACACLGGKCDCKCNNCTTSSQNTKQYSKNHDKLNDDIWTSYNSSQQR